MRPRARPACGREAVRRASLAVCASLILAALCGVRAPGRGAVGGASAQKAARAAVDSAGYRLATVPWRFEFPRDHASHPEYRVEWWYYTGHLEGGGRTFGYQLTFFRVGVDRARANSVSAWAPHTLVFAHFAVTDEAGRRFRHAERIQRAALGLAGADTTRLDVWVDDWRVTLLPDGRTHRLTARTDDAAITLDLVPTKPPVVHGPDGLSRKSATPGNASHYVSLTRLDTRGTLSIGKASRSVRGTSWMDHEFGSSRLDSGQAGWDWFALQLDDGTDVMLYRMRGHDGGSDPSSSGTWIAAGGRASHLSRDAFTIAPTGRWRSPRSGATYPQGWTVRVPGRALDLAVAPTLPDQELATPATGGIVYWEGSVRVSGTRDGAPVSGRGYVELTGYAGSPPGF